MKKTLSTEEFIKKIDHTKISNQLGLFSLYAKTDFPEEILSLDKSFIMLDLLEVEASEVVLPVVIRSSAWLVDMNRLSGQNLDFCLHGECWPVQQRIELVGGLCEIDEGDPASPLMSYLKTSVKHWKEEKLDCRICISERVHALLKKKLFIQVRIIKLGGAYKALKIPFCF